MNAPPERAVRIDSRPLPQLGQTRVRAFGVRREQVRLQHLVDLLQHIGDTQLGGLGNRSREILPEPLQHVLVVLVARRDVVELTFQRGGVVVFEVAAEIVDEEGRHQPPLVLGDQPTLVLRHVAAAWIVSRIEA
jgi:hypothetical protein